ncbi:MAG: tRNA (adenosine(37)-N6)-threonylcarbamoyltransferase complex dimerization subunit type 1 TsaB [Candidatus Nitronauta litoralis]|uniref:tRNA (Adenosine(37)-N6)-threonylcarbamoyltransferase complex dimerization subunit type 1 TsaB n=1 Tax=Candidatus Nitronauta litoralis TaxID=2705533 RepID=A0A7T0BYF8_9BACT|nr:MAG: tRNA (adenosine(37)-N6)-threonylcarbamoyltransferase complex dimerization subunit type 1 TsaB [Candidatus Nitronauta litoralis]
MKLLSIDSSTPLLSVALLDKQHILSEQARDHSPPAHNPLLSLVDQVLSDAGIPLKEVSGYIFTNGPGSFTGLRVGLSLIKGFVLATEKPVLGVSSLKAWASLSGNNSERVCSLLDARKGEVYYALFQKSGDDLTPLGDEEVLSPTEVLNRIDQPVEFVGPGSDRYKDFFTEHLKNRFQKSAPPGSPTVAGAAGKIGLKNFEKNSSFNLNQLNLRYLRKPEAEINFKGNP